MVLQTALNNAAALAAWLLGFSQSYREALNDSSIVISGHAPEPLADPDVSPLDPGASFNKMIGLLVLQMEEKGGPPFERAIAASTLSS